MISLTARDMPKYPRSPHELQTPGKTGTVQYMAPEVMRSEDYDETVDLYRFRKRERESESERASARARARERESRAAQ